MDLFKARGYYNTLMQYLPIPILVWAVLYSNAGWGWWITSLVVSFILTVYGHIIAFHHTFCHRTFKFNRVIEIILMYIGTCSTLVSPIVWCSAHGAHHKYPDTELDPHSPKHHGWKIFFFMNHIPKKPDFFGCKHLLKDKAHLWFNSDIGYWTTVLTYPLISYLLFGLYGLVFIWAIPTFYVMLEALFSLFAHRGETNEAGHKARDNDLLLFLVTFGDGNHKSHHKNWNYIGKFHRFCALLIGQTQ